MAQVRRRERLPYSFENEAQRHYKSLAGWKKWERVGMRPEMDLDDLYLIWTERKIPDLNFKGAVSTIHLTRTMEGSSTVTIELKDPESKIFKKAVGRVETIKHKALREAESKRERRRIRSKPVSVDANWQRIEAPDIIGRPVELWLDNVAFSLVKVTYSWM